MSLSGLYTSNYYDQDAMMLCYAVRDEALGVERFVDASKH